MTPIRLIGSPTRCASSGTARHRYLIMILTEIATFEVSTPQTRRAAINDLRRLEQRGCRRRRRVLLALMAVLSAVIGFCAVAADPVVDHGHSGWPVCCSSLCARISVRACVEAGCPVPRHPARQRRVDHFPEPGKDLRPLAPESGSSSGKSDRSAKPGALWDPMPITVPTYVSKPLAPRTVRTIDLSGPAPTFVTQPEVPGHRRRSACAADRRRERRTKVEKRRKSASA